MKLARLQLVAIVASVAASSGACSHGGGASSHGAWHVPQCSATTGAGGLTFTTDDGATLAMSQDIASHTTYGSDILPLAAPATLIGHYDQGLYRSTDSGCTWHAFGSTGQALVRLRRASDTQAYAFNVGLPYVWSIGTTVTQSTIMGSAGVIGMQVDPRGANHVLVVDKSCATFESLDGGTSWMMAGASPAMNMTFFVGMYSADLDPKNIQHVICVGPNEASDEAMGDPLVGVWRSTDGTATWSLATLSPMPAAATGMFVSVSPVDGQTVWLVTRDQAGPTSSAATDHYSLRLSTDGGMSFTTVADDTMMGFNLVHATSLRPDATDANVVYLAIEDGVFKFDRHTMHLTSEHNDGGAMVHMISPLPDTNVLYIGLQHVLR